MSKLKEILNRNINIKNSYLVGISLTVLLTCFLTTSYALFTANAERRGALNIVTGNLYALIKSKDINTDKEIIINPGDTKKILVSLTNVNTIDARFHFFYESTSSNIEIGYTQDNDSCPTESGVVLNKNGEKGDNQIYSIQITNHDLKPATIKFGSSVGFSTKKLSFPSDKKTIKILQETDGIEDLIKNNTNESKDYNSSLDIEKQKMFTFDDNGVLSYRYIGSNPRNFLKLDDKPFRIIGIFEVEKETGVKEKLIKVVSEGSINDTNYSYDNRDISTGISSNDGSNKWKDSRLRSLLNDESKDNLGSYYSSSKGECFVGSSNKKIECDFSESGLSSSSLEKIESVKWNLGGDFSNHSNSTLDIYTTEKENDWTGKIGLPSLSDFGYTFALGVDDKCFNDLGNCKNDEKSTTSGYVNKSWLYKNTYNFWTMTSDLSSDSLVYGINSTNTLEKVKANSDNYGVRVSFYLKSDVRFTGDGSEENPYVIAN